MKLFDSTGRIAIIALTLQQIKNSIRTIEVLADQSCDTAAEKEELVTAFAQEIGKSFTSSISKATQARAVEAEALLQAPKTPATEPAATEPAATEPAATEPTPQ
jgi:hypothetical protein